MLANGSRRPSSSWRILFRGSKQHTNTSVLFGGRLGGREVSVAYFPPKNNDKCFAADPSANLSEAECKGTRRVCEEIHARRNLFDGAFTDETRAISIHTSLSQTGSSQLDSVINIILYMMFITEA